MKLAKHLRNRNMNQIVLRRDICHLCHKYVKTMTKKEMVSVLIDVLKGVRKYYSKSSTNERG